MGVTLRNRVSDDGNNNNGPTYCDLAEGRLIEVRQVGLEISRPCYIANGERPSRF